jgi:oligopeptide transport system substrate-binding protein
VSRVCDHQTGRSTKEVGPPAQPKGWQMFQKRLLTSMMVFALVVLACGGSASQAPTTEPVPGETTAATEPPVSNLADEQVLRVDIGTEPPTLDPSMAQDSSSIAVLNGILRPLMFFDKDLKTVPALAETADVSADAKTITFTLRDAKYSNGDTIVAADLVYSWKRLLDPRLAAPYSYVMAPVAGANDLLGLAGKEGLTDAEATAAMDKLGVAAPDDKTFVVTLESPATYFLTIAALWVTAPLQQKWVESPNFTEAENYVSSGPYKLESWEHTSKLTMVPNENYYGQAPTLTRVEMLMLNDPAAAQASYEAGELDMVLVPAEDVLRVKDDPTLSKELQVISLLSTNPYYGFNTQDKIAGNKEFRIALTQAVDKETWINTVGGGTGVIANSFVMPGIPGSDENLNPYPYDLESAKAHFATALTELGYASGADIPKLTVGFNSGAGHENTVAFLTQAWTDAFGLTFDQQGSEFATFLQQRHAGAYQISRNGWGADYPHASNQLDGLFTCGGGNNDEQYCNPEFDKLIVAAAVEADQDKQIALYKQAQEILMGDAVIIPLRFSARPYLIKPWVAGLQITPQLAMNPGDQFYETMQILKH